VLEFERRVLKKRVIQAGRELQQSKHRRSVKQRKKRDREIKKKWYRRDVPSSTKN
jgi:hypothetical protein